MADARRMGKMELFAHFADKFDMKRTSVRDMFEELLALSEKELKRSGEFVIPGVCKLVVQRRKAREMPFARRALPQMFDKWIGHEPRRQPSPKFDV